MANELMNAARPVIDFMLGVRFRLESGEDIVLQTMRGNIIKALYAMETRVQTMPGMQGKDQIVKYVLTGFCDEVILTSNWQRKMEWQANLLEMEIFGTSVAGERFFDLMEKEGYRDAELAELFYTCLALGFLGKYRGKNVDLSTIKARLYSMLSNRLPDDERRLSPGAEKVVRGKETRLPRLFGLWTLGIVFFVSLGLYLIASQWMWNDIAKVISEIADRLRL